jgi:hypothetical protein
MVLPTEIVITWATQYDVMLRDEETAAGARTSVLLKGAVRTVTWRMK